MDTNALIARAKARAAEIKDAENLPAVVGSSPMGGPALGFDDFGGGGLACDLHLKVGFHGMWVKGKDETLFKSVPVVIDMSTVQITRAVRFGNPPTYFRSYDGRTTVGRGRPWADSIAEAMATDPKCKGDYASADMTLRVLTPLVVDGVTVASPEQLIGHSLAVTNKEDFQKFLKQVNDNGWRQETLLVNLGYRPRSNPQTGYKWGSVTLDAVGPVDAAELEAAA